MGAAVAAAMIRRERETVAAFRRAGAVSPDRAQPLYAIGVEESRAVARLRRRAVLREAAPGAWILDCILAHPQLRSEERRGGKERLSWCRTRGSAEH
jgi:hypothetical protein